MDGSLNPKRRCIQLAQCFLRGIPVTTATHSGLNSSSRLVDGLQRLLRLVPGSMAQLAITLLFASGFLSLHLKFQPFVQDIEVLIKDLEGWLVIHKQLSGNQSHARDCRDI